jgi:hypothetical protein
MQTLPTNIHFFVKFRNLKIHNAFDITPIFLKLWIFTNLNRVFPVVVLVFGFDEFSEGVLHGHWDNSEADQLGLLDTRCGKGVWKAYIEAFN